MKKTYLLGATVCATAVALAGCKESDSHQGKQQQQKQQAASTQSVQKSASSSPTANASQKPQRFAMNNGSSQQTDAHSKSGSNSLPADLKGSVSKTAQPAQSSSKMESFTVSNQAKNRSDKMQQKAQKAPVKLPKSAAGSKLPQSEMSQQEKAKGQTDTSRYQQKMSQNADKAKKKAEKLAEELKQKLQQNKNNQ